MELAICIVVLLFAFAMAGLAEFHFRIREYSASILYGLLALLFGAASIVAILSL